MVRSVAGYGWKPDMPDFRDEMLPEAVGPVTETSADLRNAYMPDVYDQGDVGSCTGNAVGGAVQYIRREQGLDPDFVPSRLFLYWNGRAYEGDTGYDAGAQIRDVIKGIVNLGAPPEEDWPYDTSMVTVRPADVAWTAGKLDVEVRGQRLVQAELNMKHCLAVVKKPFVFGFTVYESFESNEVANTGIVPMPQPGESILGGHAVMCVGFSEGPQRFLVRNSWGASWGQHGYCWMPYTYLTSRSLASDFWVVQAMSGIPQGQAIP
jgi:C1A family cysteine protease